MQKWRVWTVGHAAQRHLKKGMERTSTAQLWGGRSALERVSEIRDTKLTQDQCKRKERRIIFLYSKFNKTTALQIDEDDLHPCTIIVNNMYRNK